MHIITHKNNKTDLLIVYFCICNNAIIIKKLTFSQHWWAVIKHIPSGWSNNSTWHGRFVWTINLHRKSGMTNSQKLDLSLFLNLEWRAYHCCIWGRGLGPGRSPGERQPPLHEFTFDGRLKCPSLEVGSQQMDSSRWEEWFAQFEQKALVPYRLPYCNRIQVMVIDKPIQDSHDLVSRRVTPPEAELLWSDEPCQEMGWSEIGRVVRRVSKLLREGILDEVLRKEEGFAWFGYRGDLGSFPAFREVVEFGGGVEDQHQPAGDGGRGRQNGIWAVRSSPGAFIVFSLRIVPWNLAFGWLASARPGPALTVATTWSGFTFNLFQL